MKRLILTLALLSAAPAWATTYYVDNCFTVSSDSNNGTSTATPWLTIAHVDGQTFSAGDSVLFQGGCEWHEEFLPPSSGSSGNLITYGSYGTGKPIITGADVVGGGGWTNQAISPLDTQTFSTGALSGSFWTNSSCTFPTSPVQGASTHSLQCVGSQNIHNNAVNSKVIEIDAYWQLSASTATSGQKTRVFVVEGSAWNSAAGRDLWISYNGTNYQLNVCDGGDANCGTAQNVTLGTWYLLRYLVSANSGTSTDSAKLYVNGTLGPSKTGLSLTSPVNSDIQAGPLGAYNATVFTSNWDSLSVYNTDSTGASNVWYTSVAWQPYCTIFNESQNHATMAPQASASAVTATNQWFWGSSTLYVYSTSSPATAYTSPGIQACHRTYAFSRNNQNYFLLTNMILEGSNQTSPGSGAGVFVGRTGPNDSGESTGVQLTDLELRYHGWEGSWLDSVSGVSAGNYAHDNLGMGLDFDSGNNMVSTNDVSSYNLYGSYPGSTFSSLPNFTMINFVAAHNASNGLSLSIGSNYTIKGGSLNSNTYNGLYCDGTTVTGATIKGVQFYGNATGASVAAGSCTNIVFDYDIFYGNTAANFENLSGNNSVSLLNSVLDSGGKGIWVTGTGSGLIGENNITSGNTVEMQVDSSASGTFALNYSDYYHSAGGSTFMNWKGTASNFASWQTNSSQDANSISSNPLYNSGSNVYTLQSTSPTLKAGVNLGSTYAVGLLPASTWPTGVVYGTQSGLWNMGAYVTPGGINPFWFAIP